MDCAQTREQLDAYEDGELDAVRARQLEEHLRDCPNCLRVQEQLSELRHAVRGHAAYHAAPPVLRERVAQLLHGHDQPKHRSVTLRWWQLGGLMAASAAAASACVLVALSAASPGPDERVAGELIEDHVRSLMLSHLLDVESTDQHTVKPWFAGKLDYSPPVHDLTDAGFPLVGGRLDYIQGRAVAALVYQRRLHRINVFVWPAQRPSSARTVVMNGYNAVNWVAGGMTFWAVSDLNAAELEQLRALLSAGAGAAAR